MSDVMACPACGRRNRVPTAAPGRPRCGGCHRDLPWLVDVSDDSFGPAVEASPLPVLVDVWAPWCGPCRQVSPLVEQLARERAGRLKVAKVNADTATGVAARHAVTGIPTLLIYSGGRETGRLVGAHPMGTLRRWVDGHLDGAAGGSASSRQSGRPE